MDLMGSLDLGDFRGSEKQRPGYPVWWQQAAGRQMGSGDWLGPRRSWGMGRITRGPGGEVGSRTGRAGGDCGGGGGGPLRQPRGPERGGAGWLTLRDPGDAVSPWPGLVDPGGEGRAGPGRAGQGRGARCPGGSGL